MTLADIDPTRRIHFDTDDVAALAALLTQPTGTTTLTGPQARYLLDLLEKTARRGVHPEHDRVHEDCRRLLTAAELQAATPA